jgi:hypothetical protein
MKKIDLSDKKLNKESILQYFKTQPIIGTMGLRYQYMELFAASEELYRFSVQKIDSNYHYKIRQNYLINLSSSLEIHLKNLIQLNAENWNKKDYPDLLSEKISLQNAFQLFTENGITREMVISKFSSFNSLESIVRTLSKLTTPKFVSEMEVFQIFPENGRTLIEIVPHWQTSIALLFEQRNMIIHEGQESIDLTESSMNGFQQSTLFFMYAIDKYCLSKKFDGL